ncbi:MAG TPA: vitamin K epoxide reductase family protein [Thermoplasmata archaeon]|nr:vitamin K epoxide reductase family protein [Thermoplasmata archaeon]
MKTRSLWTYLYLTAGLGLIVSIYAGLETLDPALRSSCTISSYFSCSAVDASGLTSTLGIPDAVIGIVGFILILAAAQIAERHKRDLRFFYVLLFFTSGGVAFASYFAAIEVTEIHALCPVCTTAYIFGILTWVGAIALTLRIRRKMAAKTAVGSENPA